MIQPRIVLKFAICLFILTTLSPVVFAEEQNLRIQEVSQINLQGEINCLAINEKLNRIYIGVNETVVVIDGAYKQVIKTINFDQNPEITEEPQWIVVDSLTNQIYVSTSYENRIWAVNGETYALIDTGLHKQLQSCFALDTQRKRVYTTESTFFKDQFDKINIYSSTSYTEIGHMDIPGSNIPKHVSTETSILLDSELNHIYAEWMGTIFLFDCATQTPLSKPNSTEFWYIGDITQVYENKIYEPSGIVDANTMQFITHFDINEVRAFDPRNSTIYGLRNRPTDWSNESDWRTGSKYYFQAIDALTNKPLASSDKVYTYDECGKSAVVNLQTGEIYFGGKSGVLYALTLTSAPLISSTPQPDNHANGTYTIIIVAVIVAAIAVIGGIAIVLRRKKAR